MPFVDDNYNVTEGVETITPDDHRQLDANTYQRAVDIYSNTEAQSASCLTLYPTRTRGGPSLRDPTVLTNYVRLPSTRGKISLSGTSEDYCLVPLLHTGTMYKLVGLKDEVRRCTRRIASILMNAGYRLRRKRVCILGEPGGLPGDNAI